MEEDILSQIKSRNAKKQVRGNDGKFVSIEDPSECGGNSVSFIEGCEAYANENY